MRRFKRTYFVAAATLVSALAVAGVSSATHGGQTALVTFTAKGKAENKGTPGILRTVFSNTDDPSTPSQIPPQLNNLRQELSKGLTVDGSKFPECTQSLENFTTDQAQAACGNTAPKSKNALVGTAAASVQIGSTVVDAQGLAFNGAGKLIVFIRADALNVTTIIECALSKSSNTALYKDQFNCPIPPLAGGAGAVTFVDFTFERTEKQKQGKSATASKKKKKKKVAAFIRGKCPSDGQYQNQTTFTYNDHETEVIASNQTCTPGK